MLKVREISRSFNNLTVLSKISFNLEEGEVIGICGPNGSGKSTLLKIISGMIKPSCGKVFLDEKNVTPLPMERRVELGISYAFQIPRPFKKMTVFENVLVGCLLRYRYEEAIERTQKLLEQFDLEEISKRKAKHLSQGELKLLELCRSISTEPGFLLLDEPFAALDSKNTLKVRKKVKMMKKLGIGIIITAHKTRILKNITDRIYLLEFGELKGVIKNQTKAEMLNETQK
jgi:branched-chain amino acid transport system ATP-binding protein/lipopolysaccharide export system ATP-binding protein